MEENRNSNKNFRSNDADALQQAAPETAQCSQVRGRVFVTVGSSSEARFDDLVHTVTTPECLQVLKKRGYTSLVIQQGNGSFQPIKSEAYDYFQIEHFGSRPNTKEIINGHIYAASLVISHAGAGSIFTTLRARRPLVVVLSTQFVGEYELELAQQLSKFIFCCCPETLAETLSVMDLKPLVPYPPHPAHNVLADLMNSIRHFLTENKSLAPFQVTVDSTRPARDSQTAVPEPSSSEPPSAKTKPQTDLKSQISKARK